VRLLITTPDAVLVDEGDIVALRAEDASGMFGILPGHADFLTALTVSVVAWRAADGRAGYCAVRRGVLSVRDGTEVAIATRQGERGTDLEQLEQAVLTRFRAEADVERRERVASLKLHARAIRQILRALRDAGRPGAEFAP
jgi:F-type H+-transporting ATPase subunit epsilon